MVTNKRLLEELRAIGDESIGIVERKNSNYAGGGETGNAFKNFDLIEIITNGNITREAGMLVRMTDKLARLGTLMTGGEDAVGESVEDTLQDLSNYADLTLVAWRDKYGAAPEQLALDFGEPVDSERGQGSGPLPGRDVTVVQEEGKTKFVAGVSEHAKQLDKQTLPYDDPRSILSRLFSKKSA